MKRKPIDPYKFSYTDDEDLRIDDLSNDQDEEEFEFGNDLDNYDTPEGYEAFDDYDEEFQDKMRSKGRNYKQAIGGRTEKWKEQKPYSPIKSDDLPLDKYLKMKGEKHVEESYLQKVIKKVLKEQRNDRYMFFQNLEQIKRQCDLLLDMNEDMISQVLENGHDWAQDHIATAKESIDQVFDFLTNESNTDFDVISDDSDMVSEGRKKTGTKLCARGKSAAKAKFKVYPSAYANGYAVQVCKGKMPGTDGKKRCSPPYC